MIAAQNILKHSIIWLTQPMQKKPMINGHFRYSDPLEVLYHINHYKSLYIIINDFINPYKSIFWSYIPPLADRWIIIFPAMWVSPTSPLAHGIEAPPLMAWRVSSLDPCRRSPAPAVAREIGSGLGWSWGCRLVSTHKIPKCWLWQRHFRKNSMCKGCVGDMYPDVF
jgi:hypothetical protein